MPPKLLICRVGSNEFRVEKECSPVNLTVPFLAVRVAGTEGPNSRAASEPLAHQQELDSAISQFIGERTRDELLVLAGLPEREPMPRDLDRELLGYAAAELERYLEPKERVYARQAAKRLAREKQA